MSWRKAGEMPIEDVINHAKVVGHYLVEHPWYTAAGLAIGSLCALRLFCTSTAGMCRCTTDLTGKVVVITGGNVGIGKATAMGIAQRKAKVIIASRNATVGRQAVEEIKKATNNANVEFRKLDLCSFQSVREFARELQETEAKLDILINNAGVTGSYKMQITEDNCEHIMQCNYFGHFLLTQCLLDMLKAGAPSRIINVSSYMYKWAKLDLYDLNSTKKYNPVDIYNRTKLAMVLFTMEMSKRLKSTGVTINVLHPGVVKTDLVKNLPWFNLLVSRILLAVVGKTPLQGAQTSIHLAIGKELKKVSGRYFSDCKEQKVTNVEQNEHLAYQLYKTTEKIIKESSPVPAKENFSERLED